jgi:hypothetical protein
MNAAHVKVVTIEDLEVTNGSHLGSGVNTAICLEGKDITVIFLLFSKNCFFLAEW